MSTGGTFPSSVTVICYSKLIIQTSIGDFKIKVPKIMDFSSNVICFNNLLVPPYFKRVKSVKELLPLLYLRAISPAEIY
ncbi:MAG: hypothetical protein ACTS73_07740 [Arsenophonus sp. NEOnobi-MAG3]